MMQCIIDWGKSVLRPEEVADGDVLEVGAMNVNGTFRDFIEPWEPNSYVPTDMRPGDGVAVVLDAVDLVKTYGNDRFDMVVSTEMLEHAEDWQAALWNMMAVTKPDGLLVVTTRSPGFGWHEYPADCWRFTEADFATIFSAFTVESLERDRCHPGINVKARKPRDWDAAAEFDRLRTITVSPPP